MTNKKKNTKKGGGYCKIENGKWGGYQLSGAAARTKFLYKKKVVSE